MILGLCGMFAGLSIEAKRRKKASAMVLFIITFIFMLMMGYLSSKNFEKASMNWISEGVNVVGWSVFLIGTKILTQKSGAIFDDEDK
jgi:DNA-binding transcriptional regulator of glucitol operon